MKRNLLKLALLVCSSMLSVFTLSAQRSAYVTWPLTQAATTTSTIKGKLDGAKIKMSGVSINGYSGPDATMVLQPVATNWGTAEQSNVYIQFSVSSKNDDADPEADSFYMNEISAYVCGKGGSNMRANFYYSTDPTFTYKTRIQHKVDLDLSRDVYEKVTQNTSDSLVAEGDSIYFRIYPYYKTVSTGKFLCLKNVNLNGYTPGAPIYTIPTLLATKAASYVSTTTAISGGEIVDNGDATITEYGLVYGTSSNPTVTIDTKLVIDSILDKKFSDTITGLLANTTYYVRAYATNSQGTGYGTEVSFTTLAALTVPTVTTGTATSIANNGFGVNSCNVTAWGGASVTEKGIVYSISSTPTINDGKSIRGADIGSFNTYAPNLLSETKYYVRAYAINSEGVGYGAQIEVTTLATQPDVEKLVAKDGSGDFTTVSAALNAVPSNYMGRYIIRVKPGIYRERPTLAAGKTNVYLIGYCKDSVDYTVIVDSIAAGMSNGSGGTWGTSGSQTLAVLANDFTAAYLTIKNLYVNASTDPLAAKQAVALKTQGDRQSFYNCKVIGYQDTYLGNSGGRVYFKNSYIEGNVDFIFGAQVCVFDSCTTYVNRNGSVLTAPSTAASSAYGFVFLDCNLTAPAVGTLDFDGVAFGSATGKGFYFGRPWQGKPRSAFIRCNAPSSLELKGWTAMTGGLSPVFVEYGTSGLGGADLTQRGNEGVVISAQDASKFTVSNIFKASTDASLLFDWMPASSIESGLSNNCNNSSGFANSKYLAGFLKNNYVVDNLELKNPSVFSMLEIISVGGQKLVSTKNLSSGINISSLTSGVYLVKGYSTDGFEYVEKIIKK